MEHYGLIKDLGLVLLAGGLAGVVCKRLGLSAVVGYLVAGMLIGPHNLPFPLISGEARIEELSQVGLVFVMFAIGLHLSVSKLARMGMATVGATFLGAAFMLNFTLVLGAVLHWTTIQSLFVAAMLMVSSSAVIAKLMQEYNLNHDHASQVVLAVTIVEDVVAVIMLTLLVSHETGGGGVGGAVGVLGAFVALLLGAGLLLVPRLMRRLETGADPELRAVIVAGALLLLAFVTIKAGYSAALGAFLFGAVVAELRQRHAVEKTFEGVRFLFSGVFFVSVGMMIDLSQLREVWLTTLLLCGFALVFRPIACGLALILVGVPPREARRGGLLLTPLGEFTFIIAGAGISAGILPGNYYPLAVSLSVLTVLVTPVLNRYAEPILRFADRVEPRPVRRAVEAYQGWLRHIQTTSNPHAVWRQVRGRAIQAGVEGFVVSGLLIFSTHILEALEGVVPAEWVSARTLRYVFWPAIGLVALVPVVDICRNLYAMTGIVAHALTKGKTGRHALPEGILRAVLCLLAGFGVLHWLYVILPAEALPRWGIIVITVAAVAVALVFSRHFIRRHQAWARSLRDVLNEDKRLPEEVRAEARQAMDGSLGDWRLCLEESQVPEGAAYIGLTLSQLALPARFGCSVIEMERNGLLLPGIGPNIMLHPGDKVVLLGTRASLDAAHAFLQERRPSGASGAAAMGAGGSVLETCPVPEGFPGGRTLADWNFAKASGARVVAIRRRGEQLGNAGGSQTLEPGDVLLAVGTLGEIRAFRQWLKEASVAAGCQGAGG
ncbi:MAG: cation:proton antiporter [Opitutaceae bacterium]|jgi:CPA2 family monovalent cation:H+ antiporter-2|nr:cation:proton antiporter [Opitutaceae bacterium]